MPPRDRRLQRARQNPKSVSFNDLCRIYEDHGFRIRSGGRGSHFIATLPNSSIRRTFPRRNPMRRVYVAAAINAIEEAQALGFVEED